MHTRKEWGAKRKYLNGSPTYQPTIKQVHVHHTVNGNDYRRADVPGMLRSMYRYHTQRLGWFDIGYNFLVDRFGRAWVGRSGGHRRFVTGAHTLGFNHKSVGIAVIGNFTAHRPGKRARRTVSKIAAWKLAQAGRDRATGKVRMTSHGSDRFGPGRKVRLPRIDGHRDTNQTACPGDELYGLLPDVRRRAQRRLDRG